MRYTLRLLALAIATFSGISLLLAVAAILGDLDTRRSMNQVMDQAHSPYERWPLYDTQHLFRAGAWGLGFVICIVAYRRLASAGK